MWKKSKANSASTSLSDLIGVDLTTIPPSEGDVLEYLGGSWKPSSNPLISSGTNYSYVLELERWGVTNSVVNFNDKALSTNNSYGINNALTWASSQGYTDFILPKGTYLIDEVIPIEPRSYMTLNLGGSTLRIRNNGLANYSVICFKRNQVFSRVTNGIIQGDRYNHDYTTVGQASTHEWGMGVLFPNTTDTTVIGLGNNTRFVSIDNIEFFDLTGDGVSLFPTQGLVRPILSFQFESGSINKDTGALQTSTTRIRQTNSIDLANVDIIKYKYFGIYGDVTYNGLGSEVSENPFDIIFYNSNGSFNSSIQYVNFYDEIPVPSGAATAKLVLRQPNVPSSANNKLTLRTITVPKFTYIEKCRIHHCRRLGVALQGAKWVYLRDCEIDHISGAAPSGALDVEDNYSLNQDLFIENNHIHDCPLGIILVDGKNYHIKHNRIERCIALTVYAGVKKLFVDSNYFINASIGQVDGDIMLMNSYFHFSNVKIRLGNKDNVRNVDNCYFHNSQLSIDGDYPFTCKVHNSRFYVDVDYESTTAVIIFGKQPQTMTGCTLEGLHPQRPLGIDIASTEGWIISDCSFLNTGNSSGITYTFPLATYINCRFINAGKWNPVTGSVFESCVIQWDGFTQFYWGGYDFLKFNNCHFKGGSSALTQLIFSSGVWGRFEFSNNRIEFLNSTTAGNIIEFYTTVTATDCLIIRNNKFKSNQPMKAIKSNGITERINLVIENNEFDTVVCTLNDDQSMKNNYFNGVLDSYTQSTTPPITGYYKTGDIIRNTDMISIPYIGWVAQTGGYAKTYPSWTGSTAYSVNTKIIANGHVYMATIGGTSGTVAPTWPTASGSTVSDGSVMWKEIGVKAVFKAYGAIVT